MWTGHNDRAGQAALSWALMNQIADKSDYRQVTLMLSHNTNFAMVYAKRLKTLFNLYLTILQSVLPTRPRYST